MTDNELMVAFYDCEEAAYGELADRWWARLKRFFRRLGWPEQDAEDLTQETLLKVYGTKSGARYDPERPFDNWVYAAARHLAFDTGRKKKRRPKVVSLPSNLVNPQSAAGSEEMDQAVRECLATLDEQERSFVLLWGNLLGEHSQAEIAEQLGVSPATVSRIKERTLRKLAECLKQKGYN